MSGTARLVIGVGAICLILTMGIRQSFGIFLAPLSIDLDIGRQAFGLAIAVQNLVWGLVQPVVGAFADRWGALRVTVIGSLLYVVGLVLTTMTTGPVGLTLTLGGMIGLAFTGAKYVTVLGAVGRVVPPERRSVAFGIRSEEHTSELQSLMRISYAVFFL